MKHGQCLFCEVETELYEDTDLCEECDSDSVFCQFCNERQPGDNTCYHVVWDANWTGHCWAGFGLAEWDDSLDAYRESFWACLDRIDPVNLKAVLSEPRYLGFFAAGWDYNLTDHEFSTRDGSCVHIPLNEETARGLGWMMTFNDDPGATITSWWIGLYVIDRGIRSVRPQGIGGGDTNAS